MLTLNLVLLQSMGKILFQYLVNILEFNFYSNQNNEKRKKNPFPYKKMDDCPCVFECVMTTYSYVLGEVYIRASNTHLERNFHYYFHLFASGFFYLQFCGLGLFVGWCLQVLQQGISHTTVSSIFYFFLFNFSI